MRRQMPKEIVLLNTYREAHGISLKAFPMLFHLW
jgi:hypothetical protein